MELFIGVCKEAAKTRTHTHQVHSSADLKLSFCPFSCCCFYFNASSPKPPERGQRESPAPLPPRPQEKQQHLSASALLRYLIDRARTRPNSVSSSIKPRPGDFIARIERERHFCWLVAGLQLQLLFAGAAAGRSWNVVASNTVANIRVPTPSSPVVTTHLNSVEITKGDVRKERESIGSKKKRPA